MMNVRLLAVLLAFAAAACHRRVEDRASTSLTVAGALGGDSHLAFAVADAHGA